MLNNRFIYIIIVYIISVLSSSVCTNGITSLYSDRACRTILNCEQNEIKGSTQQFVLNQAVKKYVNEEAHRRARLSIINIYKVFLEYQAIKDLSLVIQENFCESKILIPVDNGSTGIMKVTTIALTCSCQSCTVSKSYIY